MSHYLTHNAKAIRRRFRTWSTPRASLRVLEIEYLRTRDFVPAEKDSVVQSYLRVAEVVGAWG